MRWLVLALLVMAWLAPAAHAGGLSASAGDRFSSTTGMVAGHPAVIVSTLYLADSDEGCDDSDDAADGTRPQEPGALGVGRHSRPSVGMK